MDNTTNLTDKLIIFISCLIFYLCQADFHVNVVIVLVSIIFSGFLCYFEDGKLRTVLTVGFCVLSCFIPAMIVFLPLIAYDMLFYQYQIINLFGVIPLILFFRFSSLQVGMLVLVMLLICVLMKARSIQKMKLTTQYNEMSDTAREMSRQLKKQNTDLIEKQDYELNAATLNERNRIAREIHDNVGHLLSSAILQSGALRTVTRDEKVESGLENLHNTLNEAMNSIRSSVHQLYDESIDLNTKIEEVLRQFAFCELSYEYQISGDPEKKLKAAFLSIVKEALSNIMNHSNATHAYVVLREHPALYQLIIRDNGNTKNNCHNEGLGLKNMKDRVAALNGIINIIAKNGFEIFISVPKEDSHENIDYR